MSELVKSLHFNNIYFRNQTYKQKDIEVAIDHLARYIDKNLVSPSPFIILTAYNHIKTVIAYYAILKAGKIAVILDPGTRNLELSEMISDVDPASIIFINSTTLTWNYEEEIIFRKPNRNFVIHSDLKDVCTIAYTNAEDGFAKGAMLTEKNLLSEINDWLHLENITSRNVYGLLLPLFHLYGLIDGLLVPCSVGASIFLSDLDLYKINTILKRVKEYSVTDIHSVPSIYYLLSRATNINDNINSVNSCFSGGTKLSPYVFNKFFNSTGKKIREGYGLTETSSACSFHFNGVEVNLDSVGKPISSCDIKIVNNKDIVCSPGEIGEIQIKGDIVFKGYFNDITATNKAFKSGWLSTGDLGKFDKYGYLYFEGLKKDMINVAGNNVYPKKLKRLMELNKNVQNVHIGFEESIVQGQIVTAQITLYNSSLPAQNEYKAWCFENINTTLLPKKWNFTN